MGVNITYMGTKKDLVLPVAAAVSAAAPGIFLDAFSGMCSVGEEVASERQVWCNDAQVFASEVATALFASQGGPMNSLCASELLFPHVSSHQASIGVVVKEALLEEAAFEDSECYTVGIGRSQTFHAQCRFGVQRIGNRPNTLFTRIYSGSYVGLRQALEIDSVIFAIRRCVQAGALERDQERWLMIALGRAILKSATTTGHFAQFIAYKENTHRRFLSQRRRSIWAEFLVSIDMLSTINNNRWRSRNKVFNQDSLDLLPSLKKMKLRPRVVYADPPYTDDQYSRFYHLLETLVLYDEPLTTGKGLYRVNRFRTSFSLKRSVVAAFVELVRGVQELGADMVLSYPSNGLLQEAGVEPLSVLKQYFARAECRNKLQHLHSTLGGSKGPSQEIVTEHIYLARTSIL